jgi:hypothetical protein
MSRHRWSGWPGAWCLDCGTEDAREVKLAGRWDQVNHRYSDRPHLKKDCTGCSSGDCAEPGSDRCNPYVLPAPPPPTEAEMPGLPILNIDEFERRKTDGRA